MKYRLTKGSHSGLVGGQRVEYHAGVKGHDIMELTDVQAKLPHLRKRIEKVHPSEAMIDLKPDQDSGSGTEEADTEIAEVLAGNVEQVLAYINDHEDDDETLEALREGESAGKARKGVLDALNDLLGE